MDGFTAGVAVGEGLAGYFLFRGRLWSPWRNVLVNTAIRKAWPLPSLTTRWRVRGQWYSFRDRASSVTLKIAYEEVCKGFYTPQVPLRAGDVVLDIGAHVGMFSIPLAREHPGVTFLAYEPNVENHANLVRNVKANGVPNVVPVNAGIWSRDTYLLSVQDAKNTGGSRTAEAPEGDEEVKGLTLDQIRAEWGLDGIRVLKMDCEGAEYHALRSASDLAGIDNLLLEVHGGDYAGLLEVARTVKPHRIQVLQDSHVTIDSTGKFQPQSLGVPA